MPLQLLLILGPTGPRVHLTSSLQGDPHEYLDPDERLIESRVLEITGDLGQYMPVIDLISMNDRGGFNRLIEQILDKTFGWGREYERHHPKKK